MSAYDHPDFIALHRAVLTSPKDDLPRLVLADWLDEHGEHERAKFIHVGCETVKPDPCGRPATCCYGPTPPAKSVEELVSTGEMELHFCGRDECLQRAGLRRRERELLDIHSGEWFAEGSRFRMLTGNERAVAPATMFARRGFVAEVHCTLGYWVGLRCNLCQGGGRVAWPTQVATCPDCAGRRRFPGVGPQVTTNHPIEYVVSTDKDPEGGFDGDETVSPRVVYTWICQRTPEAEDIEAGPQMIPLAVFKLLVGGELDPNEGRWRAYTSVDLAEDDLSAALIQWAKSVADGESP